MRRRLEEAFSLAGVTGYTVVPVLGGKVAMQPMVVPNVGRMAVIQDPQGATLSVITYARSG